MKKLSSFLIGLLALSASLAAHAQDYPRGDVNRDGEVNVADINAVIDIILTTDGNFSIGDVNGDGEVNIADVNVLIDIILGGGSSPVEPEFVDLGLPTGTLWATFNVGASCPEEYGDHFAWGETEPKEVFTWENYKWCDGSENTLTKYCSDSTYGTVDNKTELEFEDDAASVNWGLGWRMPSQTQVYELMLRCSHQRIERNGVRGILITGPNGNSIFIPQTDVSDTSGTNPEFYWSRTGEKPIVFGFSPGTTISRWNIYGDYRYMGHSVRPVRVSPLDFLEKFVLDLGAVAIGETGTDELAIDNNTDGAKTFTLAVEAPFSFKQEGNTASSITVVVPGNTRTAVPVEFTAATTGEHERTVTIQMADFEDCKGYIEFRAVAYHDDCMHQEYVDLGLTSGTLWATRNVGAGSPVEYGDHFAWGETEPKEVYNWETYKWCEGDAYTIIKYCINPKYGKDGFVDGLTELEPEDDAACVNWGQEWCMPTFDQLQELYLECASMWTTLDGVDGQMFIASNGNSLFLPAAGLKDETRYYGAGSEGRYWSSSLNGSISIYAKYLNFGWNQDCGCYGVHRLVGHSVRPVRVSQD